jgi:hypothetical protein
MDKDIFLRGKYKIREVFMYQQISKTVLNKYESIIWEGITDIFGLLMPFIKNLSCSYELSMNGIVNKSVNMVDTQPISFEVHKRIVCKLQLFKYFVWLPKVIIFIIIYESSRPFCSHKCTKMNTDRSLTMDYCFHMLIEN